LCLQVVEGDLIVALADAMAALLSGPADGAAWLDTALPTLDVVVHVHVLLHGPSPLPQLYGTIAEAGWERCRAVRLPQTMIKVRLHYS